MIHESKLHDLKILLSKDSCACAIIEGQEGTGKTTLIENCKSYFLNHSVITIQESHSQEFLLNKIVACLESHLSRSKSANGVCKVEYYEEYLLCLFDDVCNDKKEVFFHFENFEKFPAELRDLIVRFINRMLMFPDNSVKFVIEINSKSGDFNTLQSIRKLTNKNILHLEELRLNDIRKIMFDRYSSFDFTDENISILAEASFYNVGKLISLLDYLEIKNVIYFDINWKCKNINRELIMEFFKSYIISRFDMLSDINKSTLKKASIFDYYINSNDTILQSITRVKNLEESLETIQQLSNLIVRFSNQYKFENHEVYLYIQNQTEDFERTEWNKLIGNSLVKTLNQNRIFNINEILMIQNKIAYHYQFAGDYDLSLSYYISCIPILLSQFNYHQVLNTIKEIDTVTNLSSEHQNEYNSIIIGYKAQALYALGRYSEAIKEYEYILSSSEFHCMYEKYIIEYYLCVSYFNSSLQEELLLERLNYLKIKVMGLIKNETYIEETHGYKLLLIDIYHLSSTINGHVGKMSLSEKYYSWCIENTKSFITSDFSNRYYKLLGKANRHYAYALSIDQMTEAYNYFKDKNIIEYAKVAHNIGTEHMINGNIFEAEKYLLESFTILKKQSSHNMYYPLNNLGAVYSYQGQHEKALECFCKASTFEKEFFSKIWIQMNIANCTKLLGDYDTAYQIYQDLLGEIALSTEENSLLKVYLFTNLGIYFYEQGNLQNAENHLISARDIRLNRLNNSFGVSLLEYYIGKIHQQSDKFEPDYYLVNNYVSTCSTTGAFYGDFMFW